ncbi:MAG TPA: hypothetical protein VEF04_14425 [Blastocatellia bacterium]|nr:hypothetical protein [Blastocatellia bacterium]
MSIKGLILRKIVTQLILPKWAKPRRHRNQGKKIIGTALVGVGATLVARKVFRELSAYDLKKKSY